MGEKYAKGPYSWSKSGSGTLIYGHVPFKADCGEFVLKEGKQPLFIVSEPKYTVAYDLFIQFPSEEWDKMQEATAERIINCLNYCEGLDNETLKKGR